MAETDGLPTARDLGEIAGPVLAFGGPLSNLQALEALLAWAEAQTIPPDRMICTGDAAGYGADPEPCLALLRERGIATVIGNVEEALAADAPDCGCAFAPGSACEALAPAWYGHARAAVSAASRAWMAALPRRLTFRLAGRAFAVVHGGAARVNRYVFASDRAAIAEELAALGGGARAAVAGHAGLPFTVARADGGLWHNPGVLGLPANDGTPRVWASVIAPHAGGVRFAPVALAYDHGRAAARMRAAGLPEAYARALETGLWPDTAILPAPERAATGRPLAFGPLSWAGRAT